MRILYRVLSVYLTEEEDHPHVKLTISGIKMEFRIVKYSTSIFSHKDVYSDLFSLSFN